MRIVSGPSTLAPSSAPVPGSAEDAVVVLFAASLSSAIRAMLALRTTLERASGFPSQGSAPTPLIDATFALTVRGAATAAGVAGRLVRPLARQARQPPILPRGLWPPARLTALAESGRAARASADQLTDRVVGNVIARVLDASLDHIDLAAIANRVVEDIDLPDIIRMSSGTMASETVLGVRMQGIEADERLNRFVDRVLHRGHDRNTSAPQPYHDGHG
jgi:hypothetical protein